MVPPANDDQVLQPAGHEKLPLEEEPQIAGPQERAFAAVGQAGLKGRRGRFRVLVVAAGHAGALDPDFPDVPVRNGEARLRIDDQNPLAAEVLAASDQDPAGGVLGGADLDLVAGERIGLDVEDDGRVLPWAARHHERRFGQPIAGEERLPAEPAGGKGADELLDGLRADPLRAQEGQIPTAQIQLCPLLGGDLPRAEVVGEVGAAADGGPRARDRLQPQGRPLQERRRRHQGRRPAAVDRLNHAADESHVMVQRQPEDGVAFRRRAETPLESATRCRADGRG